MFAPLAKVSKPLRIALVVIVALLMLAAAAWLLSRPGAKLNHHGKPFDNALKQAYD